MKTTTMSTPIRYLDRRHAGRVLASYLMDQPVGDDPLVLALPCGGVPVGFEVANEVAAPLDVFLVCKLGLPIQPEFAMGSLVTGGLLLLDHSLIQEAGVSALEIDRVTRREERELERREELYRGGRAPLEVGGREVILVDDGLAGGFAARAAVAALRQLGCARITVGMPVGSPEMCAVLAREADLLVCPWRPASFHSIGQYYEDYAPTDDVEVRAWLCRSGQPNYSTGTSMP
ncbi:MAG: phosphoribosyltransferase [Verrucomicrobia bacterium]|nr:phosphoribosyltransferase [Verrucomicrobiota bacterium]